MKRFSEALGEDREFEVGNEVFKWRYPFWEETAAIFDEDVQFMRELERSENGSQDTAKEGDEKEAAEKRAERILPTTKESVERTIERILVFLDPEDGAHDRFRALASRKENPVPLFQFGELYRWLLEVTSGRPTTPPSASEPGDGSTEASSPAKSRSRAVTRVG